MSQAKKDMSYGHVTYPVSVTFLLFVTLLSSILHKHVLPKLHIVQWWQNTPRKGPSCPHFLSVPWYCITLYGRQLRRNPRASHQNMTLSLMTTVVLPRLILWNVIIVNSELHETAKLSYPRCILLVYKRMPRDLFFPN